MTTGHEYPGLEIIARHAMDRARAGVPPDLGVTLFLFHLGEGGGLAYLSTGNRDDMITAIVEWLRKLAADPRYTETVRRAFALHFGATPSQENP